MKIGTLPNGLRYYIRKNAKPEKRAELRLVVNAGSVLEDSTQLGLAHFVEHMAFNGTKNFAKNDIINYLESVGVRFGADLNASTSFDETIYMLPIPTDSARIVDKAFDILEDWAHNVTFDSKEVVKERGVVVEEWRIGQGSGRRMFDKQFPLMLKNSLYTQRLPIGTKQSIERADSATLRRFYNDWYRPDLMAVIAVGDFDPAAIEAQIKRHFSAIPAAKSPRARPVVGAPDHTETLVAIATDKEHTSSSVTVMYKQPASVAKTVGDYRRDFVESLYSGMLNGRLAEIAQKADAPFLGAGSGKGAFVRTVDAYQIGAGVRDGEIERGLEAVLIEAQRVDRFGFTQTELDREKQDILRAYERAFAEREKTASAVYANEYVNHFLTGEPAPGIATEYELAKQFLPSITLADVNGLARELISDKNRVIVVSAPEKEGLKVPTSAQLLAVFDKVAKSQVTAYTENVSDAPLVAKMPTPSKVVAENKLADVGVTEWRLANGVRVLLKPTDFKADEIRFTAFSPGGNSLAPDKDYLSASISAQLAAMGGVGSFNQIDLGKRLAGNTARVSPSVGALSEGMSGSASPKDVETMLQLVYLNFTAPRADSVAFAAFQNQMTAALANRNASPSAVFGDTINTTMAQQHFRARPPSAELFREIDLQKAIAFYRDRFADASDFTFVFVGNFNVDSMKPLVERYIGGLPSMARKETWKDVGVAPPKGVVEKTVRKGVEPKATTVMMFTGVIDPTRQERFALTMMAELLQIKLREQLREQLGGTYTVGVGASAAKMPRPQYTVQVSYESAPDRVGQLGKAVFDQIEALKATGPSEADVAKIKEAQIRGRETNMKQNAYWLGQLASRAEQGEPLSDILTYEQLVNALTPKMVQDAAKKYLNTQNYARFILLPENAPNKM